MSEQQAWPQDARGAFETLLRTTEDYGFTKLTDNLRAMCVRESYNAGGAEVAGDIARVQDHEKNSTDFLAEPRAMILYDRSRINDLDS